MLRTIAFKLTLALYYIIWAPILLVGLVSKKLTTFLVFTEAAGILVMARMIVGIKYSIEYPQSDENGIPAMPDGNRRLDGKAIVAAKHMSILEIAMLSRAVRNPFFIVKREIIWIPIYGWAFWRMGLQPVNRTRGKTNMSKLGIAVESKIRDGKTLIIFPEGTRAKPGQRIPLKRGLLFLAHHLKLPILPVGTDAGLFWPKHGKMHGGTAHLYFEPMLPSNASLEEISEAINRHSA